MPQATCCGREVPPQGTAARASTCGCKTDHPRGCKSHHRRRGRKRDAAGTASGLLATDVAVLHRVPEVAEDGGNDGHPPGWHTVRKPDCNAKLTARDTIDTRARGRRDSQELQRRREALDNARTRTQAATRLSARAAMPHPRQQSGAEIWDSCGGCRSRWSGRSARCPVRCRWNSTVMAPGLPKANPPPRPNPAREHQSCGTRIVPRKATRQGLQTTNDGYITR